MSVIRLAARRAVMRKTGRTTVPLIKSDALINADFAIEPFRSLSDTHRRAIVWYMAFDGDAWSDVLEFADDFEEASDLTNEFLEEVDELYGDEEFGYGIVTTADLLASVRTDKTFIEIGEEEFFRHVVQHPEQSLDQRYPVIFSDWADKGAPEATTLTDGWTRMATYVNHGYDLIPAVFIPSEHHHELLARLKSEASTCRP